MEIPDEQIVTALTLSEAAEQARADGIPVKADYLRLLANKGNLRAVKRGHQWFTTMAAVRAWWNNRRPTGNPNWTTPPSLLGD